MEVKVEKEGACFCRLTVTVDVAGVTSAYNAALRKVAKGARLPGFRAGKVPRALLEKQYALQIEQEAVDQVVQGSLYDAMQEQKLVPVAPPSLSSIDLHRGKPCTYKVSVEVRPDIAVTTFKGLAAPTATPTIDDAAITAELTKLQQEAAQTVPVEGRDVVEQGDFVLVNYLGSMDGKPFAGGKGEGALVEVGGTEYIPGFAEGLLGQKVPGTCALDVTFPDDFGAEHLRGKPAQFAMELRELKRREQPQLDDDFAKDQGQESLAALKNSIAERLRTQAKEQAEDAQRRKLLESFVAKNPFEVPPSMVDRQVERTIENLMRRMQMYSGNKAAFTDDQMADLRSSSREEAEFQVRAGLLIAALGEAEKLHVDDAALEEAIHETASASGAQAAQVHAYYRDEDHREEMRFALLEKRAMALLLEHAELQAPAAAAAAEAAEASH